MHYKYEVSSEALNTLLYNCCAQMRSLLSIVNARLIEITRFYRTVFLELKLFLKFKSFLLSIVTFMYCQRCMLTFCVVTQYCKFDFGLLLSRVIKCNANWTKPSCELSLAIFMWNSYSPSRNVFWLPVTQCFFCFFCFSFLM
jgi:hypothetical protein